MKSGIQESKNPVFDLAWFPGFLIKNHPLAKDWGMAFRWTNSAE
jgi:hypothetical protein